MRNKCKDKYITSRAHIDVFPIPGGGDRRTCNSQKDNLLKLSRAATDKACAHQLPACRDVHAIAVLTHQLFFTEPSSFACQRLKRAKVHPRKRLAMR